MQNYSLSHKKQKKKMSHSVMATNPYNSVRTIFTALCQRGMKRLND